MKKIASLFLLIFTFSSCDDGEISVQNPNFDSITTVSKCTENNLLFKIKTNDALLWNISDESFDLAFVNDITLEDQPRIVTLNSTINPLYFRAYDGAVLPTRICGIIPDASPNVMEEWITNSGIAEIVTTVAKTTNAVTGFETITGYNHSINFRNLIFQTPNGTRTENSRNFGTFTPLAADSNASVPFQFVDTDLELSDCGTNLININGNTSLALNLNLETYNSLIKNEVSSAPLTAQLSTENTLIYTNFNSLVNLEYFCASPVPDTPLIIQQWISDSSTSISNGIIEVTTTTAGSQFEHTVTLKNVTLRRGNTTFSLGFNFLLGKFFTNI